jgi:hypothetical protein
MNRYAAPKAPARPSTCLGQSGLVAAFDAGGILKRITALVDVCRTPLADASEFAISPRVEIGIVLEIVIATRVLVAVPIRLAIHLSQADPVSSTSLQTEVGQGVSLQPTMS